MDSHIVLFHPSIGSKHIRRSCHQVNISVDGIHEDTESFMLELTSGEMFNNVTFHSSVTEVFIFDHDGEHFLQIVCVV